MAVSEHTRETLICALKRHAAGTVGRINMKRFCEAARTSPNVVRRHFPGGNPEFLAAAGMGNRYSRVHIVTQDVLMREIDRLAGVVGRTPTREDLERHGRMRPSTYVRKIGCWKRVLSAYARWKVGREKDTGGRGIAAQAASGTAPDCAGDEKERLEISRSERAELVRGEPLGFRGLLHAPTTELGVVHLFGLLSADLSIAVEHIGAAYPDCRALRPEPGSSGKWRRITIEFEHRSSNFKYHGHDPKLCDLVVCWEHDWPDCPVEVLELKSVMKRVGK